jgi:hypothetical protein
VALNRDGALNRAGVLASAVTAATILPGLSQVAIHSSEVAKLLAFPRHPPHENVLFSDKYYFNNNLTGNNQINNTLH